MYINKQNTPHNNEGIKGKDLRVVKFAGHSTTYCCFWRANRCRGNNTLAFLLFAWR